MTSKPIGRWASRKQRDARAPLNADAIAGTRRPQIRQVHVDIEDALRLPTCNVTGVIMLVKLGDPKSRRDRLSNVYFLVIAIVPWAAMIWLLWPSR